MGKIFRRLGRRPTAAPAFPGATLGALLLLAAAAIVLITRYIRAGAARLATITTIAAVAVSSGGSRVDLRPRTHQIPVVRRRRTGTPRLPQ